MHKEFCEQIRKNRPLIHCITNMVTVNDCANILLAAGASPTMAMHELEVAEVSSHANALVCNLGATLQYEAMLTAAKAAKAAGHPVILDPVGVSGSTFRRNLGLRFVEEIQPECIRGNFSEIRALMENRETTAGVDANQKEISSKEEEERFQNEMTQYAKERNTVLVASGKVDFVVDQHTVKRITGGDQLMSRITGAGCMSSAMLGAFFACEASVDAAIACCEWIKYAGELAAKRTRAKEGGTMTFRQELIDVISLMDQ